MEGYSGSGLELCIDLLLEVKRTVSLDDKGRIPRYESDDVLKIAEIFKDCIVNSIAGESLPEAIEWVRIALSSLEDAVSKLRLRGVSLPKELKSFTEDPRAHLRKKLFIYTLDLIRGLLRPEDYFSKAKSALTTSLRTNMRSLYQVWGLSTTLSQLADQGFRLVYPEHRYLALDRSGKQKLGSIPPNAILYRSNQGYLSLFHEAPRPLSWEDSSDLKRIWGLYTALRPDSMVYSGWVMDMLDFSRSPPVKRPTVILEFKELGDWWTRTRDLKGYIKKPLSAEEWASMWLEGLWDGLAEALGVGRGEVKKRVEEGGLRVGEARLILLYKSTYKPDEVVLVSRVPMPGDIRRELEAEGVIIVDGVFFDQKRLEEVADVLARHASLQGVDRVSLDIPIDVVSELEEISKQLGLSTEDVLREALRVMKRIIKLASSTTGTSKLAIEA